MASERVLHFIDVLFTNAALIFFIKQENSINRETTKNKSSPLHKEVPAQLCLNLTIMLSVCAAEKSPNPSLLCLCGSLAQLACVEPSRLQSWLTRMTAAPPKDSEQFEVVQENRQLLQLLTTHIVRDNSQVGEGVCTVLLNTLIPMATDMLTNGDGTGFPELMVIMATLASAGQGAGHLQLHRAAIDWLTRW